MSSPGMQKLRRYVLTASITAITATGAWYGAGLKTQQEYHHEQQVVQEYTTAQKIDQLEIIKSKLLDQRTELQEKIDRLTNKTKANLLTPPQQTP